MNKSFNMEQKIQKFLFHIFNTKSVSEQSHPEKKMDICMYFISPIFDDEFLFS
jgi:hypothetical protein